MGKDCLWKGCPGCSGGCKCGYACYTCKRRYHSACGNSVGFVEETWPRCKYVCVLCRRVWKDKYSYRRRPHMRETYPLRIEDVEDPKWWTEESGHGRKFKGARCCKCGGDGVLVGQEFRPFKKEREWRAFAERLRREPVKPDDSNSWPVREFTFCPTDAGRTTKKKA